MAENTGEVSVLHQGRSYSAAFRTDGPVLHVSSAHGWRAARLYNERPDAVAKQLLREIVSGRS
jgi:hypothetical protein